MLASVVIAGRVGLLQLKAFKDGFPIPVHYVQHDYRYQNNEVEKVV